jgi:hypothetical protein
LRRDYLLLSRRGRARRRGRPFPLSPPTGGEHHHPATQSSGVLTITALPACAPVYLSPAAVFTLQCTGGRWRMRGCVIDGDRLRPAWRCQPSISWARLPRVIETRHGQSRGGQARREGFGSPATPAQHSCETETERQRGS